MSTVLIGECEEHDEQQGQHHENCREDGVWNRPTLWRRDKLNEFQFLICNFIILVIYNLHLFRIRLESGIVSVEW